MGYCPRIKQESVVKEENITKQLYKDYGKFQTGSVSWIV